MANDNTAGKPQFWALTALMNLFQEVPIINLVNRQFSSDLARAGDQVNAFRPGKRKTRRKDATDPNTEIDANLVAVPVVLDQYFFDSFILNDEEDALSLPELTRLHAGPAIDTIVTGVSRALCGRIHAFLRQGSPKKRAGRLNAMTLDNAASFILEAEQVLTTNNAPSRGLRVAVVHQTANTLLMQSPIFQTLDKIGPQATVLVGQVGKIYNTQVVMSQDVNYVDVDVADTEDKAINLTAGYPAGHGATMVTDGSGSDYIIGEYVTVAGNDQPTFVTAFTATTAVTLNENLKYAVVDDAVIKHYQAGANEATARAIGYKKEFVITHTADKNVQEGQLISFGTGATRHTYTVIEVDDDATTSTTTPVLLDRPLDIAVGSAEVCFPGPAGSMNPVFFKDAIAFVSRPMKEKSGKGVTSSVVNHEGVGIRVQEADELLASGTRYVVDLLAGVSVLNEDLLCVMLA